jgi:hypothetical protein
MERNSVGMSIPNIWKNKKCSKPPTRYDIICVNPITKSWPKYGNMGAAFFCTVEMGP